MNSYFAKLKSKQATYIVTGAIEPDTGHKALRITGSFYNGRDRDALEEFIKDSVKPGSLVITDKWYGYDELLLFILYSLLSTLYSLLSTPRLLP